MQHGGKPNEHAYSHATRRTNEREFVGLFSPRIPDTLATQYVLKQPGPQRPQPAKVARLTRHHWSVLVCTGNQNYCGNHYIYYNDHTRSYAYQRQESG